jgi:hypothetical protein
VQRFELNRDERRRSSQSLTTTAFVRLWSDQSQSKTVRSSSPRFQGNSRKPFATKNHVVKHHPPPRRS